LILGSQKQADALSEHFGSLTVLARASVEELLPFVPRSKAIRLVSSLRMGAVALQEERQSLTIDSHEAIDDLCSEMRFLDREILRVVLLNAKQHLIEVCTVSQGSVNESLGHPIEIFRRRVRCIFSDDCDRRPFAIRGEFLGSLSGANLRRASSCSDPWIQLVREPLSSHVYRLPVPPTKAVLRPEQRKPSPAARFAGVPAVRLVWVKR
jgi:hypothetical protein